MLNASELTDEELLLLTWSLSRIPSYLLRGNDEEVRDSLVQDVRDEQKKRGIY